MSKDFEKWNEEFQQFLQTEEVNVPLSLKSSVLEEVKEALNPSPLLVFRQLLFVHLFAGSVTLVFCPQFGIGPFGGMDGLMSVVMQYGTWACALYCGSIFMALTAITGYLVLGSVQRRVIFRTGLWQFAMLGFISMAGLMLISGLRGHLYIPALTWSALWLMGGTLTGAGLFTALSFFQKRLAT